MLNFLSAAKTPTADDKTMQAIAAGDRVAFETVVRRESARAIAVAQGLSGSRASAEDIVQEAWLKLWRTAPNWTPGKSKISTWLHRVIVNAAIDHQRRLKTRAEEDVTPYEDTLADPNRPQHQDDTDSEVMDTALTTAIAALPERQRQIISLTYMGGLKNRDVAATLNISVKAVEATLTRARAALRHQLKHTMPLPDAPSVYERKPHAAKY